MFRFKIIIYILSAVFVVKVAVNYNSPSPVETIQEDNTEEITSNDQTHNKINSKSSNRKPASAIHQQKNVAPYQAQIKKSELDNSRFANDLPPSSQSGMIGANSSYVSGGGSGYQPMSPLLRQNYANENINPPALASNKKTNSVDQNSSSTIGVLSSGANSNQKAPNTSTAINNSPSSVVSAAPTPNSCSSNIAAGSFNHPIGINLNCSSVSAIKYCVALDTGGGCCDPQVSASTYSSQIIVGPKNGTYCLSYYGQSASSGNSVVYQQSYVINSTLPNLQVSIPQVNYQTTQLNGKSFITSLDFGKTGFGIGQINLKTNDPSPTGLNYSCDDIMANYSSLLAPAPLTVLSLLDVSVDTPSMQIEIPLQSNQLIYGDNFITSYIENNNFAAPMYACSTSKIVLNDFEFFQGELAFGDTGSNTIREFTGGFSPYGFFEDDTTVYRGPAGVDTLNNAGQKLEYGMFGIFY